MKLDGDIKAQKWIWLAYPLLVVVFIFGSLSYIFGRGNDVLGDFSQQRAQVQAEREEANLLENKLETLKKVDLDEDKETLKKLLEAQPASRQVWLLLAQLRNAASEAGAVLEEYKGEVGEVAEDATEAAVPTSGSDALMLDTTFEVTDFEQVAGIVAYLDNAKPLVRVVKVEYSLNQANILVEGAWGRWPKVSEDVLTPLPDHKAAAAEALRRTDGMVSVAEVATNDTGSYSINPF